ncbi:type II toxin-antitoxin system VapB family antitoxin, partial [Ruminococcus sp. 2227st1_E6_2227SCRN_220401]|uniref:type II toxin-antitoxin system antitoxin VapB n=1 Tax=unclassified Ruminococcus TaxID=2608920 RepID=UPI00319DB486
SEIFIDDILKKSLIFKEKRLDLIGRCFTMMTAKLFENGRSQAVRLPKECQFAGDEVAVNKIGDIVILMPQNNKWSGFLSSFDMFSNDFMEAGREQPKEQERESL